MDVIICLGILFSGLGILVSGILILFGLINRFYFKDDLFEFIPETYKNSKIYCTKSLLNFILLNPKYFDFKIYQKSYKDGIPNHPFFIKAHWGIFSYSIICECADIGDAENELKKEVETAYSINQRKKIDYSLSKEKPMIKEVKIIKVTLN